MKKRTVSPLFIYAFLAVVSVLFLFAYCHLYYRTTTLTVGTPSLDWYAYREFSTTAQFCFFMPMFYWEQHYDRSNPGYSLQPYILDQLR